ncbi:MAG: hypothetical protein WDN26_23730 [Chitinophagaceae bacterium]
MIRKQEIIFIVISCFLFSCGGKKPYVDCRYFWTGKFRLNSKLDTTVYIIERNHSIQMETDSKTGKTIPVKIKWLDDCTFELEAKKEKIDTALAFENLVVKSEIVSGNKDYYIFESRTPGYDFLYKDTMWLLSK